jgi:hypothetical protein
LSMNRVKALCSIGSASCFFRLLLISITYEFRARPVRAVDPATNC